MKTIDPPNRDGYILGQIDMTPSWQTCVQVYCMVLRNPDASCEAIQSAEGELMRLAAHVDKLQGKED
jgi:hypothetical protein